MLHMRHPDIDSGVIFLSLVDDSVRINLSA
jgi:hypothetical protein